MDLIGASKDSSFISYIDESESEESEQSGAFNKDKSKMPKESSIVDDKGAESEPRGASTINDDEFGKTEFSKWNETTKTKHTVGVDRTRLSEFIKLMKKSETFPKASQISQILKNLADICDKGGATNTVYEDLDKKSALFGLFHCVETENGKLDFYYVLKTLSTKLARDGIQPGPGQAGGEQGLVSLRDRKERYLTNSAKMELAKMGVESIVIQTLDGINYTGVVKPKKKSHKKEKKQRNVEREPDLQNDDSHKDPKEKNTFRTKFVKRKNKLTNKLKKNGDGEGGDDSDGSSEHEGSDIFGGT